MTPEDRLYAGLNVAGVNALVSTRIYPDSVPQDKPLPAVGFLRQPSENLLTLDTAVAAVRAVFDIYCIAATRTSAEAIGDAAQAALVTAGMPPVSRRAEFDLEAQHYAAVITATVWN